jgi:hypothetical protein
MDIKHQNAGLFIHTYMNIINQLSKGINQSYYKLAALSFNNSRTTNCLNMHTAEALAEC